MSNSFRSGEAARQLGVSNFTVRRWVARYSQYFSDDAVAAGRPHAVYHEDDFRILLTIHQLSAIGYSLDVIEQKLADGYRYEGSLDDFQSLPTEPKVVSKKTVQALEDKINERDDLESQMLQRIAELTDRLTEAQYKLGIAEGKLEMLLQKNAH